MDRLDILLLNLFDGYKIHCWPTGRLDDSQRIVSIILIGFNERFYKLRANQFYGMTATLKKSCPIVGPAAGFHHNGACWQISYMSGQFTPSQAFLVNGLARIIGAVELKSVLGNINAQHANSHIDLPSEVKVHQTNSSLEDPAGLAAWVGMVHYISTLIGVQPVQYPLTHPVTTGAAQGLIASAKRSQLAGTGVKPLLPPKAITGISMEPAWVSRI